MSPNAAEKRRHPRYDFPSTIEYGVNPDVEGQIYKGVTINISDSGLCLYVSTPLSEGEELTIKSALPVTYHTATVCWVQKVDEDFYKTGLMGR